MRLHTLHFVFLSTTLTFLTPLTAFAQQAASFSDVPSTHRIYQAVEYLKEKGIISGYSDGTFKPDRKVNRAEAVKIIVAPLVSAEELALHTSSVFSDVPAAAWYLPYVESARTKFGIIDGPPTKTAFFGEKPVIKAEFLKMLLLAQGVQTNTTYEEITFPLATDVTNSNEWFYPHMRFAIASSMTMVSKDGFLAPGWELTRGDVSLLLYRYLMYKEGRRTQALLSETENEIVNTLKMLDEKSNRAFN